MRTRLALLAALLLATTSLCAAPQSGSPAPTITFTKEFPGSSPAYYSVSVTRTGDGRYWFAPAEEPVSFQVSSETTEQIFALADKLDQFRGAMWESKRKVAFMGTKTLRYEQGASRQESTYKHTENPNVLALTTLFERVSNTQQHADRIEYLLRFDKLGMVKELLQLEMDFDQGRLLEPGLLLPVLEKVRSNSSLVNVAQQRAAGIIAKLQAASLPTPKY